MHPPLADDAGPVSGQTVDDRIRAALWDLLDRRAAGATICPSEVARALLPGGDTWRALMPRIREVARNLAADGLLRVTRGGVEVDATAGGGPIRLGRSTGSAGPT